MPIWNVSVNVRAFYTVDAKTEKEAQCLAIKEAESGITPEEIEYAGDGVDNVLLIEGDEEE
jgi:hypothetical protein